MIEKNEIDLRSDEVQEILTRVPHWLVRWGNVLILSILVLLLVMSWYVRYPDIVSTTITITTQVPPQKLVARSGGRIQHILIGNNAQVQKGQPLAVIVNTAHYEDVFRLQAVMDTLSTDASGFNFPLDDLQLLQLGEIQAPFSLFEKDYNAYRLYKELRPHTVDIVAQGSEISQIKERLELLQGQQKISNAEMLLKKRELERYGKLYGKGIISAQEWDQKNINYLEFERSASSIANSISQLRSSLIDLKKSSQTTAINETKDDLSLFRNAMQSYNQLKKAVSEWELAFVLRTSISGKVSFLQVWTENQTVAAGDEVFTVIPQDEQRYIGKVKAEVQNSGKLKVGQRVNIRLANYPDYEFGIIRGQVQSISMVPDKDGKLLLDIELTDGIKTSYEKNIIFQQEMAGTADIVTDDLRLIERLLYQFRNVFSR